MEHAKLFRVLVMGGAALAAGCGGVAPDPGTDAQAAPDAGAASDSAIAAGSDAPSSDDAAATDDVPLEECGFCPNEACCVTDESGSRTRPGLVCCWGTSC